MICFFFNDTATTEIYTLSLHDALPILAVRIRQIVSAAIETQIKDPRLGMVTVTDARVTSDLREATVFYTVYGDATQVEDSAKALTSATGVLRSTVGRQTGIRSEEHTSELQ